MGGVWGQELAGGSRGEQIRGCMSWQQQQQQKQQQGQVEGAGASCRGGQGPGQEAAASRPAAGGAPPHHPTMGLLSGPGVVPSVQILTKQKSRKPAPQRSVSTEVMIIAASCCFAAHQCHHCRQLASVGCMDPPYMAAGIRASHGICMVARAAIDLDRDFY